MSVVKEGLKVGSRESDDATRESHDAAVGSEILSKMPSFEEHLQEVLGDNEPKKFDNKPYKGRKGDVQKIGRRLDSVENEILNYHRLGQEPPAELMEEEEFLRDQSYRIIDVELAASKAKLAILKEQGKYLEQLQQGSFDKAIKAIEDLNIRMDIIDYFPYDYEAVFRDEDSLEYQRRRAVFERKHRENAGLYDYDRLDTQTREIIFSPTKDDIVDGIRPFIKRWSKEKILDSKELIAKDYEAGCKEFITYLSGVLDIKLPPEIDFESPNNNDSVGAEYDFIYNRIIIYKRKDDTPEKTISKIAHEMWHTHQYDVINFGRTEELHDNRRELYRINSANYIQPELNVDRYYNQLFEAEAYVFGKVISDEGSS